MSASSRPSLGDLTNLPDSVRRNLEEVAVNKSVTIPLSEYNRILDQYNLMQGYIRKRELEVDTALINLSARIGGLEQQIRLAYSLIVDTTSRSEKSRSQLIVALKNLIEIMEQ